MRGWLSLAACVILVSTIFVNALPSAQAQAPGSDTVVVALQQDIGNYNFFDLASNTVWKSDVVSNFYDSLSAVDTTGDVYPYLAQNWTTISDQPGSADYLNVTVTLRPNLLFSDGTPLTADDVVFSYQALRWAGTTYQSTLLPAFDWNGDGKLSLDEINRSVVKIDDARVEFHLAAKYGQFYKQTLGLPILPKHIWMNHLTSDPSCPVCLDTHWNGDPTDPGKDILVGSGPWKFVSGVKDSRYLIERNDLFWGKTFTTPFGKQRVFPQDIQYVEFDIYSSLESAILALRSGKVDHIPWTITPGEIPALASDPNVKLNFVANNGYFYLAYNEKRAPMNDVAFRQAVSYLTDKQTIVDIYMGGFGQQGDSVEPPFWSQWYNGSVNHYEYSLAQAKARLVAAGYKGSALGNSPSTALLMPNGQPVPPIVLLTPPADYDPVRIKTGEMIAKNLRDLGVDVTAKAIDFNTLVGRMNGFDYDMIILGWSLSADPVSNVCDIMGPQATQNYFGFWDPTQAGTDNPTYRTIGGVSTMADPTTRAYADAVASDCAAARQSFDPAVQVSKIKDAQGTLAKALPVDVLYYRTNAYATSTQYTGWVVFLGNLLNPYSLGSLTRAGSDLGAPAKSQQVFGVLDAPYEVAAGTTRPVTVSVMNLDGTPASGALLSVSASAPSIVPSKSAGVANAKGFFTFNVTAHGQGFSTLIVNATLNGQTATLQRSIDAVPASLPSILFVEGSTTKPFLLPGETTTISWTVRNETGAPVQGANVSVDPALLAYGTIMPPVAQTASDGIATMTYSAPSTIPPNANVPVNVVATPAMPGVSAQQTNTYSLPLVIKGGDTHVWNQVTLLAPATIRWAANSQNPTVTIGVHDADSSGAPVAGATLVVSGFNASWFAATSDAVTTDAAGNANLTLTWATQSASRAATLRIAEAGASTALGTYATLLYAGTDGKTGLLGGYVSLDRDAADPNTMQNITATVHLIGENGAAPAGKTPVAVVVGATPFGTLASLAAGSAYTYSSVDDGSAIQVATAADGRAFTTGGTFAGALSPNPSGAFTSWNDLENNGFTSVNTTLMAPLWAQDGVATFSVAPQDLSVADRSALLTVVPGGVFSYFVTPDQNNYYWTLTGNTSLGGDFAVDRTNAMTTVLWSNAKPLLQMRGPLLAENVTVTALDENNHPVPSATASVYYNGLKGPSSWPYKVGAVAPTNADGTTTATLSGTPGKKWEAANGQMAAFQAYDEFVSASVPGAASLIGASSILVAPVATTLTLSGADVRLGDPPGNVTLLLAGTDGLGHPLSNWTVALSASAGSFDGLVNGTVVLGPDGTAHVVYHPPTPSVVPWALADIKASTQADGYAPALAETSLAVVSAIPSIDILTPSGQAALPSTVNVTGLVTDPAGLSGVSVAIDDGAFEPVPIAVGLPQVTFSYAFSHLAPGTHKLSVRAVDSRGFQGSGSEVFTVQSGATPTGPKGFLGIPGPSVPLLLAGCAGAALLVGRRKE
jgi:ABC-type transport system substrate-binding protein